MGGDADQSLEWASTDTSTHFAFQHRIFWVPGARFTSAGDPPRANLLIPLGSTTAALTLPGVQSEFSIGDDDEDGRLLAIIEKSLNFVREIRPGDSIPREILDGTASWKVEERHQAIAHGRLSLLIACSVTGDEAVIADPAALAGIIDDPEMKERVQDGVTRIAEKLALGKDQRQQVLDRMDIIARELSYIEALREHTGAVRTLMSKVGALQRAYQRDRASSETILRIQALLKRPAASFGDTFDQVDAMTGEIIAVLRDSDAQVQFIRETRDDIHRRMMTWEEVITEWVSVQPVRGAVVEAALKNLYRFAARCFPQRQDWRVGI